MPLTSFIKRWRATRQEIRSWMHHDTILQSELEAAARAPGARSRDAIQALFSKLQPVPTGHNMIRLGPDLDGGYVLPDDLDGIDAMFSPGVSDEFGFDSDIARRGMAVHMADASVAEPAGLAPNMHFESLFIGAETKDTLITMQDWVTRHQPGTGDLILQMDIEGAEYPVLPTMSRDLMNRFRIIVMEYHDLHQAVTPDTYAMLEQVWTQVAETHAVAHVHINNCGHMLDLDGLVVPLVIEVTYLRRDRLRAAPDAPAPTVPHPLDRLNDPRFPPPPRDDFWRV